MKHHTNKKKRLLWIVTGIVLIYCAILLAAHHIDRGLSPDNDSSGYGDLTERFSAKYSINYKRQNDPPSGKAGRNIRPQSP